MNKFITAVYKTLNHFNLSYDLEPFESIHNEIIKGISFRGTNLWILFFAIIIASVGLNTNSTAVIIGAMLISPLMGPINGIGYSIATYNFELLKKSIKNFTFAVFTGLIASTVYFLLSPLSTAHSELLARTSPTFYDVLIALFGGMAGIVAISSKLKGNVIPGVAIATALMPPLCTAGYGLATWQTNFFFGAFYLFTINTVFIALAAMWISKILEFPLSSTVDSSHKKRVKNFVTFITLIIIVPSIFFAYKLVKNEKDNNNYKKFISEIYFFEGNYLLDNKLDINSKKIDLVYGGNGLNDTQENNLKQKLITFKIEKYKLSIKSGFVVSNNEKNITNSFKQDIFNLNFLLNQKNKVIDSIQNYPSIVANNLLKEIHSFYPQIIACSYSHTFLVADTLKQKKQIINFICNKPIYKKDKEKLNKWLQNRLNDTLIECFYKEIL